MKKAVSIALSLCLVILAGAMALAAVKVDKPELPAGHESWDRRHVSVCRVNSQYTDTLSIFARVDKEKKVLEVVSYEKINNEVVIVIYGLQEGAVPKLTRGYVPDTQSGSGWQKFDLTIQQEWNEALNAVSKLQLARIGVDLTAVDGREKICPESYTALGIFMDGLFTEIQ